MKNEELENILSNPWESLDKRIECADKLIKKHNFVTRACVGAAALFATIGVLTVALSNHVAGEIVGIITAVGGSMTSLAFGVKNVAESSRSEEKKENLIQEKEIIRKIQRATEKELY